MSADPDQFRAQVWCVTT